jgi:hypothetical protein
MPDLEKLTDKELAAIARQFLLRVQLTGQEVEAYNAVLNWLEKYENPKK